MVKFRKFHQEIPNEQASKENFGFTSKPKMLLSVTKKKLDEAIKDNCVKKLKMKIERLLIDNNGQTNEALKHIYTALIANSDIEIQIDIPEEPPILTDDSISEEEKLEENEDEEDNLL